MTAPGNDGGDSPPREHLTIWERLDRLTRGPKPTLTHDRIAASAIEIADEHGFGAVSMRRLADRLGVATMALYRYVAGKNDVFELMIDAAHTEITLPPESGWRTLARSYAEQMRAVGLRHPWLTESLARTPNTLTPSVVAIVEQALTSVDGLGLDADSMMAVFGTVTAFVRGATGAEVAQRAIMRKQGGASDQDTRLAYLPYARRPTETGRYPTLTRCIAGGSNEADAQWHFEFGLECVLDGIAARLGI
jgi:AcrR family transcriptional regulator